MNNIFNNLTNSLTEEFKKYELDEEIQLNLSKIAGYDLQINNLVKYNLLIIFFAPIEKISNIFDGSLNFSICFFL